MESDHVAPTGDDRHLFRLAIEERQEIVDKLLEDIRTAVKSRDRCRAVQTLTGLLRLDLGQQLLDSKQPPPGDPFDARAVSDAEDMIDEHRRSHQRAPDPAIRPVDPAPGRPGGVPGAGPAAAPVAQG